MKVQWQEEAPWYREVQDGLNWFAYCTNRKCEAFKQLVVANRGYGIFKLEQEISDFACPVCGNSQYELRNMGFVNCEWAIKGALKPNTNSKIFVDGQTFDKKLFTFKETDYKTSFEYLNIFVKKRADGLFDNNSNEDILSDSSIAVSNYGPSSRRVEMNLSKKSKHEPKNNPSKKESSGSIDVEFEDGKLKLVKKQKSKLNS